jgi:signal transduction histidine kinase
MNKWRWPGISWRSLRFRLVGWYLVLLLFTLIIFSIYIFFQFRDLQQAQQDATLQAAASNAQGLIDRGPPNNPGSNNIAPHFRNFPGTQGPIQDLNHGNIQVRLLSRDGTVTDSLGNSVSDLPVNIPNGPGFTTISTSDNVQWRIFTQPLGFPGNNVGWLQVAQPVTLLNAEFGGLFTPILLGALMALVLAMLGGLFLANRALTPIDRVTRTAQAISTRDLSRRINYHGPEDEIGRLAKTLDLMLDRLEKGFEQERRFTSDASHELRTPLTALKGRLEVTLSRTRSEQEYQQTLADLSQEVDRLVRLSNSLLYLARLDQSNQTWEAETLNLSDLLDSIVDSMQGVAALKQIELRSDIPPDLHVQGNLDQLTRLFLNLVDNAIKYTAEDGQVAVRLEKNDKTKMVCVSVADTGEGIAPEHIPHLFERFYRAQSDRASTSGGAGLGLAIAYEIARQHNGTLEVESQLGKGTIFRVRLPLPQVLTPK